MQPGQFEYVGFWERLGAFLIDSILLGAIWGLFSLVVESTFQSDLSEQSSLLLLVVSLLCGFLLLVSPVLFLVAKQATPGKMVISAKVVDERTGGAPSVFQCINRYLGYLVSSIFNLGFIWIAFDDRKQGWHDKIAGTMVIRPCERQRTCGRKTAD